MSQPVPWVEPVDARCVLAALGATARSSSVELYDNGARHIVVTLSSEAADLGGSDRTTGPSQTLGVTGRQRVAGAGSSWRSRMFWEQAARIAATGSAAGPIACHLARHGLDRLGRGDRHRAGCRDGPAVVLHARAEGRDAMIEAVEVGGSAVVVARGEFRLPG